MAVVTKVNINPPNGFVRHPERFRAYRAARRARSQTRVVLRDREHRKRQSRRFHLRQSERHALGPGTGGPGAITTVDDGGRRSRPASPRTRHRPMLYAANDSCRHRSTSSTAPARRSPATADSRRQAHRRGRPCPVQRGRHRRQRLCHLRVARSYSADNGDRRPRRRRRVQRERGPAEHDRRRAARVALRRRAAPASFGKFGGDLLVGNFSSEDSVINAFNPMTDAFVGSIAIDPGAGQSTGGLWDLTFGVSGANGSPNVLYFTDGIDGETAGLFGALRSSLSLRPGRWWPLVLPASPSRAIADRARAPRWPSERIGDAYREGRLGAAFFVS